MMLTLRCRLIFPVCRPPIEDGMVAVDGARIVEVGRFAPGRHAEAVDLGNAAVLPGFVNAHAHLQLSEIDRPLGHAGIGLADWIRLVLQRPADDSRRASAIARGLNELGRTGTTAVADISTGPWPKVLADKPRLAATVFREMLGPNILRAQAALCDAAAWLDAASDLPYRTGLSPHAPYTARPEIWQFAAAASAERRIPLAVHLAESRDEIEFLQTGQGPLRQLLDERRAWSDGLVAPRSRPLDYLKILAKASRVLVVHGNYLDAEEIALLASRSATMSVVYCPRTHAYFGHERYPLERMLAAGVCVAVGTDSRASSPDLSMLAELRQIARSTDLPRGVILKLGTLGGARAMGIDDACGSFESGKRADLAIVALPESGSASDPHELLFDGASRVTGRYLGGVPDDSL